MKSNIITIDGPAGSGKSTVSRLLSKKIDYVYLDTGAMYRAVALIAGRNKIDCSDDNGLEIICKKLDLSFRTDQNPPRLFNGTEDISDAIRSSEMDMLASDVSAVKVVRNAMCRLQQKMAESTNLIAEGRDMGTVVFPDAKNKFFLIASLSVRAERRYRERKRRGDSVSLESVKAEIKKRDSQDTTRVLSPLKPADDAKVIDSSNRTPDRVVEKILGFLAHDN
jgi:cytidylate kinase